jgi:hypothetical protein
VAPVAIDGILAPYLCRTYPRSFVGLTVPNTLLVSADQVIE